VCHCTWPTIVITYIINYVTYVNASNVNVIYDKHNNVSWHTLCVSVMLHIKHTYNVQIFIVLFIASIHATEHA
jgi:hypothetical protein